nr:MAG TPA: hypothetical protein [Caudoviricetes sp.]
MLWRQVDKKFCCFSRLLVHNYVPPNIFATGLYVDCCT